jgi:hypothetical protein
MNRVLILAAVLAAPLCAGGTVWRDASPLVSGGSSRQAEAEQEKSQVPATEPVPSPSETDRKQQDQKQPDQKQPDNSPTVAAPAVNADQSDSKKQVTSKRKRKTRRKAAPTGGDGEPHKVVIHRGGTNEPVAQIVPGVTQEEAARQRESAGQLLVAAETDLKELAARSLKPHQEQLIVQIRQYMDGARSALKESDPQRAHTLALKAYLLSDDLVKH